MMTLKKHFLHPASPLKPISIRRLVFSSLIAFGFAITFYSFLHAAVEAYRLLATTPEYECWILSDLARQTMNLFFASISVIFAQSFLFAFLFDRARKPRSKRNFLNKTIVNDQRNLNWAFLHWTGQTSSALVALYVPNYMFTAHESDFLPEYRWFIILLVLVLFLHPWMGLLRKHKRKAHKWMLLSFLSVSISTVLLSLFNPIDHESTSSSLMQKNYRISYNVQLPKLDSNKTYIASNYGFDIYIMQTIADSTVYIGLHDTVIKYTQKPFELVGLLHTEMHPSSSSGTNMYSSKLYVDRDVPMHTLNAIRSDLYTLGIRRIHYAFEPVDAQNLYMRFYRHSIGLRNTTIPSDSLHQIPDMPTLPLPPCTKPLSKAEISEMGYRCTELLITENGSLMINDKVIAYDQLFDYFESHLADSTKHFINLNYLSETTFEDYLQVVSTYTSFINKRRDRYCMKEFGMDYISLSENYEDENRRKKIRKALSKNNIIITENTIL